MMTSNSSAELAHYALAAEVSHTRTVAGLDSNNIHSHDVINGNARPATAAGAQDSARGYAALVLVVMIWIAYLAATIGRQSQAGGGMLVSAEKAAAYWLARSPGFSSGTAMRRQSSPC